MNKWFILNLICINILQVKTLHKKRWKEKVDGAYFVELDTVKSETIPYCTCTNEMIEYF